MLALYKLALSLHVAAGIVGLAAFWTPAFARKGSTTHVQVGWVFYKATCVIALTGLAMAAAAAASRDSLTAIFLVYLVVIAFAPVYHGVRVLETRGAPNTPFHTTLGVAAIVLGAAMIVLAVIAREPVFAALGPLGFLTGRGSLRFAR